VTDTCRACRCSAAIIVGAALPLWYNFTHGPQKGQSATKAAWDFRVLHQGREGGDCGGSQAGQTERVCVRSDRAP